VLDLLPLLLASAQVLARTMPRRFTRRRTCARSVLRRAASSSTRASRSSARLCRPKLVLPDLAGSHQTCGLEKNDDKTDRPEILYFINTTHPRPHSGMSRR